MKEENKLIAEFMGFKPINMTTQCCSCRTELTVGSDIRYTKNYDAYCNNGECSDSISTIGSTTIEPCWFDGDDDIVNEDELCYDTSWNWLMPVVKRIRGIEEGMLVERIDFMPNDGVAIHIIGRDSIIVDANPNIYGDRDAAYKAVVEFIKWYNENK
jgi:hypothetical protein